MKKPPTSEHDRPAHLANLAHATVLQLRDAIRRVTATQLPADGRYAPDFLAGVAVTDSNWGEWQETAGDGRRH